MIKQEIKINFQDTEKLNEFIIKSYFLDGDRGKINGKKNYLTIDETDDDVNFAILKSLNNATIKITNDDIIDGNMRFMVDESNGDLRIYPISIYCLEEGKKYSFY
jgi:hypothetical protein